MTDFGRSEPVKQDVTGAVAHMAKLWMAMAASAADIAHARRQIFLAYVAEGFSEQQALELVKAI
jgi:hypothetical protein